MNRTPLTMFSRLFSFILLGLVLAARPVAAFVLSGPPAGFQTGALNYNGFRTPQNIGEEYRWNIPVLTYGFDTAFINYFGTNGMRAVDAAFRQLNDLPASTLITDEVLTNNFPFNTQGVNPIASSAKIYDIKSWTLSIMLKELGLLEAERYVWTLRNRWVDAGGSPTNYIVLGNRNLDPITRLPSDTVNGQRFTYGIADNGTTSDALENENFSSVSSGIYVGGIPSLNPGGTYSSLTYDDVGGVRYLYATNNFNTENLLPSVSVISSSQAVTSPWFPVGATNVSPTVGNTAVNVAIRGGIDKVTFVRVDFDSLIGSGFVGLTNTFTDSYFTNNTIRSQTMSRPILQPDIMISAVDLGTPNNFPLASQITTPQLRNNDAINGLAGQNGPGLFTVDSQWRLDFSNQRPFFHNYTPINLVGPLPISSPDYFGGFGFFDETTLYEVFPTFLNLQVGDLEQLVLEASSKIE